MRPLHREAAFEQPYGIAPFAQPSGIDLNTEGFPFYCGRIRLKGSFELAKKPAGGLFLQLVNASMASASIKVNGVECGVLRWKPFVVEITKAARVGSNEAIIEMATTLVNCLRAEPNGRDQGQPVGRPARVPGYEQVHEPAISSLILGWRARRCLS